MTQHRRRTWLLTGSSRGLGIALARAVLDHPSTSGAEPALVRS